MSLFLRIAIVVWLLCGCLAMAQQAPFDPDENLVREYMIGDWEQAPGELTNGNVIYSMRLYRDGTAVTRHTYPADGYYFDFLGTWSVLGRTITVPHNLHWIKKGELSSDGTYVGVHNDNSPEVMLKKTRPVLAPDYESKFDLVCDHASHGAPFNLRTGAALHEAIAASAVHVREPGHASHHPKFTPAAGESQRPLAFFNDAPRDTRNREKLTRIIATAAATVARVRASDARDPRLYFLDTQQAILQKLAASTFFKDRPLEFDWLVRVVERFMTSLELAITETFAIKGADDAANQRELDAIMALTKAGFWWKPAMEDAARIRETYVPRPWPSPQLPEWVAAIFMLAHIDGDLQTALALEGIGSDAAYAEVGNLVQAAWEENSNFPRVFIEWGTIFEPILQGIDPMRRRTLVRARVQQMHTEAGLQNPRRGARLVIKNGESQTETPTPAERKFRAGCNEYHEDSARGTLFLGPEVTREGAEEQAAAHRVSHPRHRLVFIYPTGPAE